jgi:translation initiation factor 2B subunit (eIF-2B alpha/beta/delta family)
MDYQTFKKELHNLGMNTTQSATQILDLTINLFIGFLNTNNSLPTSFKEEILSFLSSYQPEMSIFENLHHFLLQEIKPWTKKSLHSLIINYKKSIIEEENESISKLVIELKKLNIKNMITISYSKLVLNSILEYIKNNKLDIIMISSSPPKFEGVQFAKDLSGSSKTTSIVLVEDTLLASQLKILKNFTAVVVGCDSIFADGSILNKSGSYMLAILCQHFKIPFFVLGSKFKKRKQNFDQKIIKTKELTDLSWYDEELKEKEIKIVNKYFDYIPSDLITKIFY